MKTFREKYLQSQTCEKEITEVNITKLFLNICFLRYFKVRKSFTQLFQKFVCKNYIRLFINCFNHPKQIN